MNILPCFKRWMAIKRYRAAVFIHWCREPTMSKIVSDEFFSRSLGGNRQHRNANIRMLSDRWSAKEPQPADYGLPAGTAPSKHAESTRSADRQ